MQKVAIKKSGHSYVAVCPYHDEKTGSLLVYASGRFACLSCGAGGTAKISTDGKEATLEKDTQA